MNVYKVFHDALAATSFPVTQQPVVGDGAIYLTFFEVIGHPTGFASNQARRIEHIMQVDIFARKQPGPELVTVLLSLKHEGIQAVSWGPMDYEPDTKWHHLPITCKYTEISIE